MRFARVRDALRTSLWFVPTICVAIALLLAQGLVRLERQAESGAGGSWAFGGGAESARTLLSTLAASMITFLGLTFSITMVVLQLTSSQYSPRVLRTFLRDRQSQATLGIFVGTFVYVVMVLREIRGQDFEEGSFVPGLAITVGIGLLLASLAAFVAYINHMAQAIRPESIIDAVAKETADLILERRRLGADGDEVDVAEDSPLVGAPVRTIPSDREGVLQSIDVSRMVQLASDSGVHLTVRPMIGDFVPEGAPLLDVRPVGASSAVDDLSSDSVHTCVGIGPDRTMQQDIAFGFRQLVDIAERALSPGVNDPTTAVQVIDRLHGLLRRLGEREMPARRHADSDGVDRVDLSAAQWEDYVHLAFDEIRHYGSDSLQVIRRLLAALDDLQTAVPAGRRAVLAEQTQLVRDAASRSLPDRADRANAQVADPQGLGAIRGRDGED